MTRTRTKASEERGFATDRSTGSVRDYARKLKPGEAVRLEERKERIPVCLHTKVAFERGTAGLKTEEGKESSRYIDLPALGLMLIGRSIRKRGRSPSNGSSLFREKWFASESEIAARSLFH